MMMNKPLTALSTKLIWQLNELTQKLLSIEQQLTSLEQKLDFNQQKIASSCTMSALILPELEIARGNFIMQQQQHQTELTISKVALQAEQQGLMLKQIRLNTELKLLEKHQKATLKSQQQQTLLKEQNNSDEWVLQHRESR